MSKLLFGIVATERQAVQIVQQLHTQGVANSEISALMPDQGAINDSRPIKGAKTGQGSIANAPSSSETGGILELLAGTGALAVPRVGPFIAAGAMMAVLSSAAIHVPTCEILGGLVRFGIPETEAKRYDEKLRRGNYLLAVYAHQDQELDRAKETFKAAGGEDISTVSELAAN
jgi:hypothetical protein